VVDLPTRKVEVYHIELLDYTFPEVTLLVHISAGGYVRSLARDISRDLGGSGVVTALRRTKIANIPLETSALSYAEGHPGEYIGIKEI